MKYAINEKILNSAVKCSENFACLLGNNKCTCDVVDCSSGTVHFVTPLKQRESCKYKMTFGYSYTCNCPVRKEIYNLYKA
jgi:hypothetical protein